MQKPEIYLNQIREWEYSYCINCERVRYSFDLELTERGIRCSKCGNFALEAPAWVFCPHLRVAVKCPRAGKGIERKKHGEECEYRCSFRKA